MDTLNTGAIDPGKKTICLIAEGSYPYITGGVSSWIQDIISGQPEFNFIIYALSAEEDQELKYTLPDNVIGLQNMILTSTPSGKRNRVRNEFFTEIEELHQGMMERKDYSHLTNIIKHMRRYMYREKALLTHYKSWEMTSRYGELHNPLDPFSDYFWGWRASHEYILKILTWPIPEADLYHTVSTGYAGLIAAVARVIYNRPVILTEHGLYNKEREIDIKRASWVWGYQRELWINIFNSLSRICYDYADTIISLFELNRNIQISQGAPREKTLVIPNGIDIERFLDVKKETREEFSVGIVARVVPIKDIKNFIIMAKIISESIKKVKFYIIGPIDEDERYEEECRKLVVSFKISDKVEFTGKANVLDYYSFLDVLVLSSIREAQPLVILEAYSAGIPVVSTRVGNVPEMLNYDDRLLADPKDSEKLARGVITLYEEKEYRESLVKKNREHVIRFNQKKDLLKQYRDIYTAAIEKNRAERDKVSEQEVKT